MRDAAADVVNENAANGTTVGVTASADDADANQYDHLLARRRRGRTLCDRRQPAS